jgi:hypothetical protein
MRSSLGTLVREPQGKISLRRPRLRLEDNIKMDLSEVDYGVKVWTGLNLCRIRSSGSSCEHTNEFLGSMKGGSF